MTSGNKKMMGFRKDILLIAGLLACAFILFLVARIPSNSTKTTVVARENGKVIFACLLSEDGEYPLMLADGNVNVLWVQSGAVFMKEANCRDGLCIGQGRMRSAAKTIVCLPHNLVITLEGEPPVDSGQDGIDVIIR